MLLTPKAFSYNSSECPLSFCFYTDTLLLTLSNARLYSSQQAEALQYRLASNDLASLPQHEKFIFKSRLEYNLRGEREDNIYT